MIEYGHFIGGKAVAGADPKTFAVTGPSDSGEDYDAYDAHHKYSFGAEVK